MKPCPARPVGHGSTKSETILEDQYTINGSCLSFLQVAYCRFAYMAGSSDRSTSD